MNIYLSPKYGHVWILQPYRTRITGVRREEQIRAEAKELDMRYLCVTVSADNALHVAFSTEKDGGDFASKFASYCADNNIDNAIYFERGTELSLLVVIENGNVKQDRASEHSSIIKNMDALIHSSNEQIQYKVFNYQFLDEVSLAELKNALPQSEFEDLSAPLTDTFSPEDAIFLPEREALNSIKSRRPWLLYGIVVLALILLLVKGMSLFLHSDDSSSNKDVDPYYSFKQAFTADIVQLYPRMAQDYNVQVGLMTLPGWVLDKITITKGQTSYRMLPNGGDIATLSSFAEKSTPRLHVMISANDVSLIGEGSNYVTSDEPTLFNVEEVHRYLRDSVNEFIPNSEITFIRDVPKGGVDGEKRWFIRELNFNFKGVHKEDLITLGAIAKGDSRSPLPVSLGGDSTDPNAGQYIVDGERFTGAIKISIYGDKS
ncbi:hypothetical protein [Shewanella xiamenensis]|uniref:hypothetical protein n=1 Tax=Shewanella xiamenensis TaxID=332186 RepID=UPI0021C0FD5C|nr:hypothetical protein [Shewanella xiamenensis]MCT8873741.1 hypothetical protein [Shewanella xiamenensis]